MQPFSVLALVLLACPFSGASSALLHAARKSTLDPSFVTTFGGRAECAKSPARPDASVTLLWLPEHPGSPGQEEERAYVLSLYSQMRGRRLRLAVLRNGVADVTGPLATRAQLERALAGIASPEEAASGPELLDALNENSAKLGAKWSAVLLVGHLPKLDPDVESYAQALLAKSFATQQLRVFLLSSQAEDQRWAPLFESLGGEIVPDVSSLAPLLDEVGQTFLEVTWTAPEPPDGFVVFPAAIEDAQEQRLAAVPDLAATTGVVLPAIEKYAAMRQQLLQVSAWLQEPPTAANQQRIGKLLLPAQAMNPIDPAVLRVEAILGEQTGDSLYAVKAATLLTRVRPNDGSSFIRLAQALVLASELDKAEAALNTAAELRAPPGELGEEYARVHLGRKDQRGALPYLAQALLADGKRQDLWFLQAETADQLHESQLAISSFERGLALGGIHVADSCSLVRVYTEAKEPAKAHTLALHTVGTLPPDPEPRIKFAECLDSIKLPTESLEAWKSVLVVRPDAELAHVRVAQLLLETGDRKGAEEAAESSLKSSPESGPLYLTKADAIQQQGRIYEARSVLEAGAAGTQDPMVLTRLAAAQEAYGDRAPAAYAELASVLAKGSPERFHALERGFSLSLRDGNLKQAATFAALLDADGHPEYRALLGEKRAVAADTLVPGGLEAFSVIAHVKPDTPPERFFAEYARQLVSTVTCVNNCAGDRYTNAVQSYFAAVAELEGLGKRNGDRVTVVLSLNGKDERNRTQNVLKLLGMQMHNDKGKIRLDRGEKESQSKKQDVLSALQIDEIGMEDALGAGKTFSFEIHDEYAAVYPSAKMWKGSFPKLDQSQFALMLLHKPEMARLYVGISTLDRSTVQALIGNSGLFWFTGRPAELLSLYGSSFAVEGTHASVPGGTTAEPVWSQMVGVAADHPGAFYQALLDQKSPSLLAYFYALSNLDRKHQAFFTANLARTKRFFALFATLPESQALPNAPTRDSSFNELLRSVPIDDDGHVAFPGSPQVWEVAKGNASDDRHVAKMMKKVSRTATPDIEDDVLLRLVATRYKSHSVVSSELDNFLSIAGIDAHRADPLDEESALMLAQHYSEFSAAYPYFTDLTAIDAAGFRSFFTLVDGISRQPLLERQLEMGQVNSLIEWVVLINRSGAINDAQAARLFTEICDRLAAANDEGTRARTSLDLAQAILSECGHGTVGRWDDTLRTCLLGGPAGKDGWRSKDYEVVLDEQKAPSLEKCPFDRCGGRSCSESSGRCSSGNHPARQGPTARGAASQGSQGKRQGKRGHPPL